MTNERTNRRRVLRSSSALIAIAGLLTLALGPALARNTTVSGGGRHHESAPMNYSFKIASLEALDADDQAENEDVRAGDTSDEAGQPAEAAKPVKADKPVKAAKPVKAVKTVKAADANDQDDVNEVDEADDEDDANEVDTDDGDQADVDDGDQAETDAPDAHDGGDSHDGGGDD
jgi:hypothetical protein